MGWPVDCSILKREDFLPAAVTDREFRANNPTTTPCLNLTDRPSSNNNPLVKGVWTESFLTATTSSSGYKSYDKILDEQIRLGLNIDLVTPT